MSAVLFRKTDLAATGGSSHKMVIAIDGPAGSGKGTLAKKIAERMGFAFLDTGALYRAVGYAVLEAGGDPARETDALSAVQAVCRHLTPELLAAPELRTRAVSDAASKVAVFKGVREALLQYQRDFAKNPPHGARGAVIDGRDIGTVICPDADVKLFVTASPEVRAERRMLQIRAAGGEATYDDILKEVLERDARDSGRATAPTRAAEDAFVLDTSTLNPAETLAEAVNLIRARVFERAAETA